MDLSVTRRILAVIITAITALAVCLLSVSLLFSSTLGSPDFLEKKIVTSELVSVCNAQLDRKFAVLAEESGVPVRVFQAAETNYSTETALLSAFRNLFGDESPELYNKILIDYFDNLITEYLDAAETDYQSEDIRLTAERAAKLFSDTVGLHGADAANARMTAAKKTAKRITTLSAILLVVLIALLWLFLYRSSQKALVYLLAGISAGGLGTLLGALLCMVTRVHEQLVVIPEIYDELFAGAIGTFFVYLALISAAIAVVFYALMYIAYKQSNKKSERKLIF